MIKILVPFHPKWAMKIAQGEKQYEFRTYPVAVGTIVFIYVTKNDNALVYEEIHGFGLLSKRHTKEWIEMKSKFLNGKVIGAFVVDRCVDMENAPLETQEEVERHSCLTHHDLFNYANGRHVFAWHVSKLRIFDEPKSIKEFIYAVYSADMNKATYKADRHLYKAPQKFCYVEEEAVC